jgi:hypothetical protein
MDKKLKKKMSKLSDIQREDFEVLKSQTDLTSHQAYDLFEKNKYDLVDSLTYYNDPEYKPEEYIETETDEIKLKLKELRAIAKEKDRIFEVVAKKLNVEELFKPPQ